MADIKQNFAIVCDSAVIEKDTNKLYILGIFENIHASKLPAVSPKFSVVTNFKGGTGEHIHKIVIKHEDGESAAELTGKIIFGPNQRAQYVGSFIGMSFAKFGRYNIEVYVNEILQPITAYVNVREQKL